MNLIEDPGTRNINSLLTGLGLLHENRLLNAAMVLFGKKEVIASTFPQCVLRLARFKGVGKDEFVDHKQEYGHAFDLLIRAQRFLMEYIPVSGKLSPGSFERGDQPLYPVAAIREALANAICHRDYSMAGGSVTIAIFDDRLEITNCGTLHFGLIPDD